MRRTAIFMVFTTKWLVGCSDKAKPDYDECVHQANNDNFKVAALRCQAAVSADPASSAGKAAADKLKEVQSKLDAEIAHEKQNKDDEAKRKIADDKAKSEREAKQASADAACKKWATICDLGENGSGLQFFKTKAECQDLTTSVGKDLGAKCDPCKCFD